MTEEALRGWYWAGVIVFALAVLVGWYIRGWRVDQSINRIRGRILSLHQRVAALCEGI